MKILLLYYSRTGHTLEAAQATAAGLRAAGGQVEIVAVRDFRAAALATCQGLIVASPCWAGSVTPWGVAKPVLRVLEALPPDCLAGKRGGGIAVNAKLGGRTTVMTLGSLLSRKGCRDYRPGPAAKAGSVLSLWKGPAVGARDLARFQAYGTEFVKSAEREVER